MELADPGAALRTLRDFFSRLHTGSAERIFGLQPSSKTLQGGSIPATSPI